MSEDVVTAKNKDVYVSEEDMEAIERFFTHFKLTTSKELNDARADYIQDKNVNTQRMYRFQLAKEIGRCRGQNELLDDLFKNVMDTSDKLSYDMEFDNDLEEIIGVSPEASKP